MKNLNAENLTNEIQSLIKALKDCGGWVKRGNGEGWFNHEILEDALALINSQEQRIKELTENSQEQYDEGFVKGYNTASEALADQAKQIEILTRALDAKCDECIARERADTVRKMQERLKAASHIESTITGYRYSVVDVVEIDQIAKEMLEGEK